MPFSLYVVCNRDKQVLAINLQALGMDRRGTSNNHQSIMRTPQVKGAGALAVLRVIA